MAKKAPRRRPGRPENATQVDRVHVHELRAQCPRCHSTKRTPYRHVTTIHHGGTIDDRPYTHVEKKRAQCADCGQHLMVSVYLFEPAEDQLGLDEEPAN